MPDISPELAARIEQLRSSHDSNPARFFMPLASAYREAGELGKAEELLRENLKRHPGYLSAHVLLGRCLADRGATEEARNEFGYVLSIDPQNLIALRTLGEMAAAEGDATVARRWYGELLSVDPMNAEARQALEGLDSAPAPVAEAPGGWDPFEHGGVASPAPVDSPFDEPAPAYGETRIDDTPFDEPELMDAPGFDVPATLEPSPELGFGAVSLPPPAPADEPAADLSGWGDVSLDEPFESAPAAAEASDALDFGTVDLADDWSSAPAEPLPAADAGWGFNDAPDEPVELRSFHDEDAAGEDEVEMVTETMAELYYRQGFVDRAADVYRELVARRGHEPALIGRLAELETELRNPAPETPAPVPEETATSWLDAVDAAMSTPPPIPAMSVAGGIAAPAPLPETSFEEEAEPLPMMSFADDAPASHHADAFAESFADGFDAPAAASEAAPAEEAEPAYAAPFDAERDAWTPPTVEPTAPVEDEAFGMEPAFAAESINDAPFAAQEPVEEGTEGSESVAAYLWTILSWRPGGVAAPGPAYEPESYATDVEPAAPAPLEYHAPEIDEAADAGAPPPAEPWDDVTLGAAEEQPPLDEPWMADGPAAAEPELIADNDDDEPWAVPAAPTEEILPADDAAGAIDELPWLAMDEPVAASEPAADHFVPSGQDFAPAGTEGAGDAAADEPMPWEMGLDVPPAAEAAPAPAPAEPVGGFSFEDFFSDPAPAPTPAPAPPPAAPAAETADDDEDLESFQAWLQSLKR